MNAPSAEVGPHGFHLRFRRLFAEGRDRSVPCDEHGRVDLDRLSDAVRDEYFFARTLVGRSFARPAVEYHD